MRITIIQFHPLVEGWDNNKVVTMEELISSFRREEPVFGVILGDDTMVSVFIEYKLYMSISLLGFNFPNLYVHGTNESEGVKFLTLKKSVFKPNVDEHVVDELNSFLREAFYKLPPLLPKLKRKTLGWLWLSKFFK